MFPLKDVRHIALYIMILFIQWIHSWRYGNVSGFQRLVMNRESYDSDKQIIHTLLLHKWERDKSL